MTLEHERKGTHVFRVRKSFLYDAAQITIPTDTVDEAYLRGPQRWDTRLIRNFMIFVGPISSLYDFLTFYVLLHFFHAPERLFHTGWFVQSLAAQTLVLFVIRTAGNPWEGRPSVWLTVNTLAVVASRWPSWFHGIAVTLFPVSWPFHRYLSLAGRSRQAQILRGLHQAPSVAEPAT